jgi:hypothetical protein
VPYRVPMTRAGRSGQFLRRRQPLEELVSLDGDQISQHLPTPVDIIDHPPNVQRLDDALRYAGRTVRHHCDSRHGTPSFFLTQLPPAATRNSRVKAREAR